MLVPSLVGIDGRNYIQGKQEMAALASNSRRFRSDILGNMHYTEKRWIKDRKSYLSARRRANAYVPNCGRSNLHGIVIWEKWAHYWVALTTGTYMLLRRQA